MTTPSHNRTQALLLISKLLDARDSTSLLTLILDTAEQTAAPLIHEYITRATKHKTTITYISFSTLVSPPNITYFIRAWDLSPTALTNEIKSHTTAPGRHLLIFDSLHPVLSDPSVSITQFLPPLITPTTTALLVHHTDIPLPPPPPYQPSNLQLLHYLATTILTVHSLPHILDEQRTRQRSVAAPVYGIREDEEGILQGLGANESKCVVEMEQRRKSGRAVGAIFVVDHSSPTPTSTTPRTAKKPTIQLLDETAAWKSVLAETGAGVAEGKMEREGQESGLSFELGLTEKQRRDREAVVLPYFDAQRAEGGGEGGRILYEMGVEDDFDEEEDEI